MRSRILTVFAGVVMGAVAFFFIASTANVRAECPGDPGTPCSNGDVNADGSLNVADAVYLLTYLFVNGEKPVEIACSDDLDVCQAALAECEAERDELRGQLTTCHDALAACQAALENCTCDSCCVPVETRTTALPATGQTKVHANGDDGSYQAGCPMEGRFVDNGDGTVTDLCTGLMWQKVTADIDGNGSISASDRVRWPAPLNYAESLELAGYDDWRIPNVRELLSIVDYGRYHPSIDPVFQTQGDPDSFYWSSTTYAYFPNDRWLVHFFLGIGGDVSLTYKDGYVRAVRTADQGELCGLCPR